MQSGGHVITIVPVSWNFHEAPIDCWRIYPEGMRALYEEAGLEVELCKFETLEKPGRRRMLPGVTARLIDWRTGEQNESVTIKSFVKDLVRWPITCAFDTIAIGSKVK